MKHFLTILFICFSTCLFSQPQPCGENPAMTSFCNQACVICDIDGFTGVNDLTAQGQGFSGFCTTQYNNMQYIAFIAGSESLTIEIDVFSCNGGVNSLEVGFFESTDCETFDPITECDTQIPPNTTRTFETIRPLTVGQHYYLVIDGSNGTNCSWTFNVTEGSTNVTDIEDSGEITFPERICLSNPTIFETSGATGASFYTWTLNGVTQSDQTQEIELNFQDEGIYEICVTAENACNSGPQSCTVFFVDEPGDVLFNERVCESECFELNGIEYCETGSYIQTINLVEGCDSLIFIDVEILPQAITDVDLWICNGESYFIGATPFGETGSYSETILSSLECDSLVNLELLVIECEIVGSTSEIPVVCKGTASGTLVFSVDQGEPPLTYTYTNIQDGSITGSGMTDLLTNNEIQNIPVGFYQIYISDNFGNDVVVQQEITEPDFLNLDFTPSNYFGFNVSCSSNYGLAGADGSLLVEPYGGVSPYFYEWSDGQTTQEAINLSAEEYTVTITDDSGCTLSSSLTLTAPPELEPIIEFRDPNCDGFNTGEIEIINVIGGTPPYTFSMSDGNYTDNRIIKDLNEGIYTLFVRDANDCVFQIEEEIIAPEIPVVSFLDDISIALGEDVILNPIVNDVNLSGIVWSDSSRLSCSNCLNPTAMPVNSGSYDLLLTSSDGCTDVATINFKVEKRRRVYIPNVFSPDANGVNDVFSIFAGNEVAEILQFKVYDKWGNKVYSLENFQANDSNLGWNGLYRGKQLDPGIFVWMAEVLYIDDVVEVYSDNVSLIR